MIFVCQVCRRRYKERLPRCECGAWEQMAASGRDEATGAVRLSDIGIERSPRLSLGDDAIDEFFGGGLVPSTVNLLYGPPGWGKSTLLLSVARKSKVLVLYATSEETEQAVARRAKRLGFKKAESERLIVHHSTKIEEVLDEELDVELAIVDSAQGFTSESTSGLPGEAHMVHAVTCEVVRFAQNTGIPVFLIGQINAKNKFSGRVASVHGVTSETKLRMVHGRRTMRITKNREGATPKRLVLEMTETGIEVVSGG